MQEQEIGFDPDALRQKYKAERDKRVRDDGNDQYREVVGDFAYFVDDPYIAAALQRGPVDDEIDVAIIGGGFGGMLAAARLREAGIDDFRIIENRHGRDVALLVEVRNLPGRERGGRGVFNRPKAQVAILVGGVRQNVKFLPGHYS